MNPKWLENKIIEMAENIQDIKHIMKAVSLQTPPPPKKETKYPINKGK